MDKKYQFTDETIDVAGKTLHRIIAVRDFGNVKEGTLGGYIESESNLSHDGSAWVYGDFYQQWRLSENLSNTDKYLTYKLLEPIKDK